MMKVSILMSSYNHEKFVAQAIENIISQSFTDWELLIMDDCSTDKTYEIAKSFESRNHKIKVLQSSYNRGMVQNTNELISLAQGEYIAVINSDDNWRADKLEKQVKFLDANSEYGACFTAVNMIDEDSKILEPNQKKYTDAFYNIANRSRYEWLNHFFYHGNSLCYPSSMVRKNCYNKVGFFNPGFIYLLDLDMWIRICMAGYQIHIIQEELTNFRLLENKANLSGVNQATIVRGCLENQRVLQNYSQIKNFEEFTKIFPGYSKKVNDSYEGRVYLLDLIIKSFFSIKKVPNSRNIQNFGLSFLQDKILENPEIIKILEKDFDFSFKKYLYITSLYPCGISLYNDKMAGKNKWYYKLRIFLLTLRKRIFVK
jgi:glycosyltransferase involved in cell wall biosynthesis